MEGMGMMGEMTKTIGEVSGMMKGMNSNCHDGRSAWAENPFVWIIFLAIFMRGNLFGGHAEGAGTIGNAAILSKLDGMENVATVQATAGAAATVAGFNNITQQLGANRISEEVAGVLSAVNAGNALLGSKICDQTFAIGQGFSNMKDFLSCQLNTLNTKADMNLCETKFSGERVINAVNQAACRTDSLIQSTSCATDSLIQTTALCQSKAMDQLKFDLSSQANANYNALSSQAQSNYCALSKQISDGFCEIKLAEKDEQISELRTRLHHEQRCRDGDTIVNLSNNINNIVGNAIAAALAGRSNFGSGNVLGNLAATK